jgi:hypothetical protein
MGETLGLVPGRAIFSKTSISSLGPTHPPIQYVPSVLSTTIQPPELEATSSTPFLLCTFMARGHIYPYLCLIAICISGWSLSWWVCAENVRLFSFLFTWWKFNWNVQHAVYAGVWQTLTRVFFEVQKLYRKPTFNWMGTVQIFTGMVDTQAQCDWSQCDSKWRCIFLAVSPVFVEPFMSNGTSKVVAKSS